MRLSLSLLLVCISLPHLAAETPAPEPGTQVAQHFSTTLPDGKKESLGYWLYFPKPSEADAKAKLPMVLFLHGSGERGTNLDLVKKHGPPSILGKNKDMDGCLIASPQCPDKQWWDAKVLKLLCDDLVHRYPVDKDRIYLTGLSMGGFATWTMLAQYPRYWAAAVPICGGGEPQSAEKFKTVPIWAFHGAKDPAVPVKASQEMIAALEKAGGKPKFTIYPNEEHQSWIPAYNDPELWTWLLSQKRSAP